MLGFVDSMVGFGPGVDSPMLAMVRMIHSLL